MKLDKSTLTRIWLELCELAFGYKAIPDKAAKLLMDAALLVAEAQGHDVREYKNETVCPIPIILQAHPNAD